MTPLSGLTGKELIAALERAGFQVIRVKGSHHSGPVVRELSANCPPAANGAAAA